MTVGSSLTGCTRRLFGVSGGVDERTRIKKGQNHTYSFLFSKLHGSSLKLFFLHVNTQDILENRATSTLTAPSPKQLLRAFLEGQVVIH